MRYIKDYLNNLELLSPIATNLSPSIEVDKRYKAFIFDIYGTLLISSSGDVDEADPSSENLNDALLSCNIKHTSPEFTNETALKFINEIYDSIKKEHLKYQKQGIEFPEIVIEDIFTEVLNKFIINKILVGKINKALIKKLVFIFELKSNKVWPMPTMKEIIHRLDKSKKILGIVSNAQFYTPLLLNHFLNQTYSETEQIAPFDNDLIQYSYKSKRGKPDTTLFKKVLKNLKNKYDINPNESVYIGNDMLKDIYTASICGMDTVLFAGDKRSLRLRENDERCKNLKPTHIITELSQLEEII